MTNAAINQTKQKKYKNVPANGRDGEKVPHEMTEDHLNEGLTENFVKRHLENALVSSFWISL